MTDRKTDHSTLTGWSAVGALATVAITQALTAFATAFPLEWLINKVFGGGMAMRAIVGSDHLSYWRCVGLFAIWFTAHIKIKFSGPAQIKIGGRL